MNLDSLSPFILSLVTFIPAGGGLLILLIPRRDRDIKLFAFVISLVGCFYGLRTTGGTQGVGRATTKAVVIASVWVFVMTSFLTRIFVNLH